MEKGSDLAGKLMKIDIHPLIRETLVSQQSDIFYLRKQLIEQANIIENIVDNLLTISNANDAMLKQYKSLIDKNGKSLKQDEALSV